MHAEFIRYGSPSIRLIEECSELIQAICKGERFGYDDANPFEENALSNRNKVLCEITDVKMAIDNFTFFLEKLPHGDIKRKQGGNQ